MVLMGAALAGCMITDSMEDIGSGTYTSALMRTDDPQKEIGEKEHPVVVAKYGGEYSNAKVEALLAVILGRLVSVSEDKSRIYKATILDTPKVNAFALPGGYIYVTRGLLALANDTAELAAVLAHEMAHVAANHAIMRKEQETSNSVGDEVVSNVLGKNVATQVALAANRLRLAEFSKEQELQADALGIRMLGSAGFDAHGAARFLETMQAYHSLESRRSGRLGDEAFMSSHPTTPERISLARKHARFFGAPGTGEADRKRYLKGIDGLLFGDSAEEGFVRDNRFIHAGLGISFSVPSGVRIENQPTAVVANGPQDIATRFDAAILPIGQSLVGYMKSGWVNGLDEATVRETTINGYPAVRAKAYGGKWEFYIHAIQLERQVYRFITAGDRAATGRQAQTQLTAEMIVNSFRRLSESEQKSATPLRIQSVQVGPGDTLGTLSARMRVNGDSLQIFRVYNGLSPGELPQPGDFVKTIDAEKRPG